MFALGQKPVTRVTAAECLHFFLLSFSIIYFFLLGFHLFSQPLTLHDYAIQVRLSWLVLLGKGGGGGKVGIVGTSFTDSLRAPGFVHGRTVRITSRRTRADPGKYRLLGAHLPTVIGGFKRRKSQR